MRNPPMPALPRRCSIQPLCVRSFFTLRLPRCAPRGVRRTLHDGQTCPVCTTPMADGGAVRLLHLAQACARFNSAAPGRARVAGPAAQAAEAEV